MITASGYANMMNSRAARNYTAARSADFRNRVQWTNSYYQMRHAHRIYEADHSRLSLAEITKIAEDAAPNDSTSRKWTQPRVTSVGRSYWMILGTRRRAQNWKHCTECER